MTAAHPSLATRAAPRRPLVVELLGPAGAGKSTLLKCLAERDPSVRVDMGVWTLPRSLLVVGALQVGITILRLCRAAHAFLWDEAKYLIKLRALEHQLVLQRFHRYRVVAFDEGPVFALSWLHADAHRSATNGGLAAWWPRALERWAERVDVVVYLDGSDSVLAERIRTRAHGHPFKHKSDGEIAGFLGRYRAAYARVLADLQMQHGPRVLSFHTDRASTAEMADQLLAAFERARPRTATAVPREAPQAQGPSLSRKAALTAVASLLDYGAQLASTLWVTPILVRGLGNTVFGVWEMLKQSVTYMTATDGRPAEALRLVTANQQARADAATTRRHVGAALVVWLLFLPLFTLGGAILVWLAPTITHVSPALHASVRLTCALLVLSFVVATLGSIPESVLRGMNLGYKRMGWQAGLNVVGALLLAGAMYAGWGLRGLGAAQFGLVALTGLCFLVLVRNYVPAFGVARPAKPEVKSLLTMSAWLTGGTVITHLLASSDVLILGTVLSPAVVATYVLTTAAPRTILGVFDFTVGAAMPGLGGVIGAQQYERAAQLQAEILRLTWLFVTAAGATILLWNRSFLSLWVGSDHYAGVWANLCIVCIAVQMAFIRAHQHILDATLLPKPRVIVTAIAAALTVGAALALTPSLGIVGMCLGILLGRATQLLAYPLLVAAALHRPRTIPLRRIARPIAVTALLFTATAYLGQQVIAHRWAEWLASVALSFGVGLGVVLFTGLSAVERRSVFERCVAMGARLR